MSGVTDTANRSANVRRITSLRDPQVYALATVLAANVRYALEQSQGAEKWMGNACVDYHTFPITLGLLNDYRLPALSVWRQSTQTVQAKKRTERRSTFVIRYWLDSTPRDWLPIVWPALQAAYEIIARTLVGDSVIDLQTPGPNGPRSAPSSDLLVLAGFTVVDESTIRGAADFATEPGAGHLYPVLEITFEAEHHPTFGGLPYSCEFPNGLELSDLQELCFELWDGTPVESGGRGTENQPIVAGKSLLERSMEVLGGDNA